MVFSADYATVIIPDDIIENLIRRRDRAFFGARSCCAAHVFSKDPFKKTGT